MKQSEIEHIIRSQEALIENLQQQIETIKSANNKLATENTVLGEKIFVKIDKQKSEEHEQEMGLLHETEVSQTNIPINLS